MSCIGFFFRIIVMNAYERAKRDIERITGNANGWGAEILMTAPDGITKVKLNGIHAKIHLGVNTEGVAVNSQKAHISISEKFLTDANYPIRNAKGEVDLRDHRFTIKDSTGIKKNYVVNQFFPDETIGLISCILEKYE